MLVLMASKTPHKKELGKINLKAGEGITGWVARENKTVAIKTKAYQDERFKSFDVLPEDRYEAFLSVPIIFKGKVIGVINIQHKDPYAHTVHSTKLINTIAKQVGGVIEHARLYEDKKVKAAQFDSLVKVSQSITSEDYLDEILNLIVALDKISHMLERKGVKYREYLSLKKPKTQKLPIYQVKVEHKTHFVYSESELARLSSSAGKEQEPEVLELFEASDIEDIEKGLAKLGLNLEDYYADAKPRFKIDKNAFTCLKEVLHFVLQEARKGMVIQRYKGLGEMNPEQLWETTMDPERRTLLRISLEDAVEADETFTVLMGGEVGPRREFIENFAHRVKNLDV